MVAYQQQDPDPLRLHTTLLTTVGCSLRVWPFHGDRISRLSSSLLPQRHPLPLPRSKTSRLPARSNGGYWSRWSPVILFDGQGPLDQPLQHRHPNGLAWTCTDRNRILHQILPHKTQTRNRPRRDEIEELRRERTRQGNSGPARSQQVRHDSINNAADGSKTRTGLQTLLSSIHSRFTRRLLRGSNPQPIPGRYRDTGGW